MEGKDEEIIGDKVQNFVYQLDLNNLGLMGSATED